MRIRGGLVWDCSVSAAEKSDSGCHDNSQTALCVIAIDASKHGSPVFIREISVIRGFVTLLRSGLESGE